MYRSRSLPHHGGRRRVAPTPLVQEERTTRRRQVEPSPRGAGAAQLQSQVQPQTNYSTFSPEKVEDSATALYPLKPLSYLTNISDGAASVLTWRSPDKPNQPSKTAPSLEASSSKFVNSRRYSDSGDIFSHRGCDVPVKARKGYVEGKVRYYPLHASYQHANRGAAVPEVLACGSSRDGGGPSQGCSKLLEETKVASGSFRSRRSASAPRSDFRRDLIGSGSEKQTPHSATLEADLQRRQQRREDNSAHQRLVAAGFPSVQRVEGLRVLDRHPSEETGPQTERSGRRIVEISQRPSTDYDGHLSPLRGRRRTAEACSSLSVANEETYRSGRRLHPCRNFGTDTLQAATVSQDSCNEHRGHRELSARSPPRHQTDPLAVLPQSPSIALSPLSSLPPRPSRRSRSAAAAAALSPSSMNPLVHCEASEMSSDSPFRFSPTRGAVRRGRPQPAVTTRMPTPPREHIYADVVRSSRMKTTSMDSNPIAWL
eukprot:NODE_1077_length_1721_cov_37.982656_g953_i0.p1 GENE.NODE_1077_length_1721_cov_37.982656_g953_i0~~NODE_1077_length_1721_cov_37.982656_g953_i0.p1  ORF type:complete len:485 (+),score=41.62 NODE_1077_length_1721_cov_37.982656_g953_i0:42-1496(+)